MKFSLWAKTTSIAPIKLEIKAEGERTLLIGRRAIYKVDQIISRKLLPSYIFL